jgi:4'-phosphopantetheinyl transferase
MNLQNHATPDHPWSPPPENPAASKDEVHVWRASLNPPASQIQALRRVLTADERARAERFYFPKHRDRFAVARGVLRTILGRYLGITPDQLQFTYNQYGKPSLTEAHPLRFNLSHSHTLALCAVTCDREVGVDLEHIRPDPNDNRTRIARRFFSAREVLAFEALHESLRDRAFFSCWTRKEAFIKAKGKGLSLPLGQFDVSVHPEEPAALLHTKWDPQEAALWSLQDLHPGPGYAAALAVEGAPWRLRCWQWPEEI